MKRTKIICWIVNGLFALFMIFTAVPNVMVDQGSIDLISTQLGFPQYFIPFLGWAKILGSIAILIPGYPTIKEWAYAGLFFDLAGATFASIALAGVGGLAMLMFVAFHLLAYFMYRKLLKETKALGEAGQPVVASAV